MPLLTVSQYVGNSPLRASSSKLGLWGVSWGKCGTSTTGESPASPRHHSAGCCCSPPGGRFICSSEILARRDDGGPAGGNRARRLRSRKLQPPQSRVRHPRPSPPTLPRSKPSRRVRRRFRLQIRSSKQGKTGVEHWAGHIQAQKDRFDGKITPEQTKARFKATRLKGPGDLDRYEDALSAYKDLEGSCKKVDGADSAVAASLVACEERSNAQEPLMAATAAGMKDWKAHLTFMQRNALHEAGTPSEALDTWLKQYDAAPKNIKAFKKASGDFDAPSC